MNRVICILAPTFALAFASVAAALCVTQETEELNNQDPPYWYWAEEPDGVEIVILRGSSDHVFRFHITDCSGNPANVNAVFEDLEASDPDPVIRLEIVEALDVKRITIDQPGITSIIEGINAAGDLLLPTAQGGEAMTVDQVTGDMRFGDPDDGTTAGLRNALTVSQDLDGMIVCHGDADGAILIGGDVNQRMFLLGI